MGTHDGTCSSAVSETSLRIASCVASCCCAYPAAAADDDDDEGDEEEGEEGGGAEGDAAAVEGLEEGAELMASTASTTRTRFKDRSSRSGSVDCGDGQSR